MNKVGLWMCIGVAVVAVMYVAVFRNDDASVPISAPIEQPPIVDPTCEPGYELVGEGCMPAKDACELQGDAYYFDDATKECRTRSLPSAMMEVRFAVLDSTGKGSGTMVGCGDAVNMVTRTVPRSSAVLDASLKALFAEPAGTPGGSAYNVIGKLSSLEYERATIADGTANIYLTGSLAGLGGTCDDPRPAGQMTETALQFPSVQKVQFYLNGEATNLIPSEK